MECDAAGLAWLAHNSLLWIHCSTPLAYAIGMSVNTQLDRQASCEPLQFVECAASVLARIAQTPSTLPRTAWYPSPCDGSTGSSRPIVPLYLRPVSERRSICQSAKRNDCAFRSLPTVRGYCVREAVLSVFLLRNTPKADVGQLGSPSFVADSSASLSLFTR